MVDLSGLSVAEPTGDEVIVTGTSDELKYVANLMKKGWVFEMWWGDRKWNALASKDDDGNQCIGSGKSLRDAVKRSVQNWKATWA